MKYQLNPNSPYAFNGSLKDNGDETSTQPIIINPMIVDDKYGFISPDRGKNMLDVIVNNKGIDIDQVKAKCLLDAEAFCKKQYPDT